MYFILFSILMFGHLFVIRMQRNSAERALISQNHLTKIGTAMTTCLILGAFFFSPAWSSAFALSVLALYAMLLRCLERRRLELYRRLIPNLLDAWILNLRLGLAESHARERALKEMDPGFAKLVRTGLHSPLATSDSSFFHPIIAKELQIITQTPHFALQRLECLRSNLKRASDFRRRSGQATRQTRIQSISMIVLLIALSLVAIKRYGWSRVGDLVGYAAVLAFIGTFTIQLVARKTKWKT